MQEKPRIYEAQKQKGIQHLVKMLHKAVDLNFKQIRHPQTTAQVINELEKLKKQLERQCEELQLPKADTQHFLELANVVAHNRGIGMGWIELARVLGETIPAGARLDETQFYTLMADHLASYVDKRVEALFVQPKNISSGIQVREAATTENVRRLMTGSRWERWMAELYTPRTVANIRQQNKPPAAVPQKTDKSNPEDGSAEKQGEKNDKNKPERTA